MEWKKVRLGEIAEITTGKSNVVDAIADGQYPFYDRSDIVKRSNKWLFDRPSAVIVPGESSTFLPKLAHGKFDLHQRAYAIFPKEIANAQYLYYVILNAHWYFAKVATGSTVSSLRLGMFQDMPISLPPIQYQRRIASVLSSLDRKIALNRAINHNLEAMAKQLYDYWFVQFDFPDEGGRPYKSSGGEMVWNERLKREIPKGWKVARLDSLARIFTGKKDVSKVTPGKYKFFSCAPAPIPSNDYIYDGEAILVSGNGSYTGRVSYYKGKMDLYQRTYGLEILPRITPFVYYTMKILFEPYHSGGKHGSSIPYIVLEDLGGFEFPFSEATVCHYVEVIRKSFDYSNTIIPTLIESLTTQRDTLLPLLMNGQVSVNSD